MIFGIAPRNVLVVDTRTFRNIMELYNLKYTEIFIFNMQTSPAEST